MLSNLYSPFLVILVAGLGGVVLITILLFLHLDERIEDIDAHFSPHNVGVKARRKGASQPERQTPPSPPTPVEAPPPERAPAQPHSSPPRTLRNTLIAVLVVCVIVTGVGAGLEVWSVVCACGVSPVGVATVTPGVTPSPRAATVTPTPKLPEKISITEYVIPASNAGADDIIAGPDGNLWFIEDNAEAVVRMNTHGQIMAQFPFPQGSVPSVIVSGSDGNLWVLENESGGGNGQPKIVRLTPQGQITAFPVNLGNNVVGLAAGPDGNLWFTVYDANEIGVMNTSGKIINHWKIPTGNSGLAAITAGPDGNLWFDEQNGNKIGKITPTGQISEYPYPQPPVFTNGIQNNHNPTAGPDGNVWFTDFGHNAIGRVTPSGQVMEKPLPTSDSPPPVISITAGPDGNLWFTVPYPNIIGCITPAFVFCGEYTPLTSNGQPAGITIGPDGNLWFTEYQGNEIGKITIGS